MDTYFKVEALAGDHIASVINNVKGMAQNARHRNQVREQNGDALREPEVGEFDFNGITVLCGPDTVVENLQRDFSNAHKMGWLVVGPLPDENYSPETIQAIADKDKEIELERQRMQAEYEAEVKAKDEAAKKLIEGQVFEVADVEKWEQYKKTHADGYGAAILSYAQRWAMLMQVQMADGKKLEDVAEKASFDADVEGITGFMYGAAVKTLFDVWKYGKELNKWHNKKYSREDEEGTINPAVLIAKNK